MTIDNASLEIERRYLETNDYFEAIHDYRQEHKILDYEDIIETLNPILINKIKTEAYKKNYFPDKKITNSLEDFF